LKEALKKSSDGRVVNVSSMYNMKGVIDVDNLNGEIHFDGEQVSRGPVQQNFYTCKLKQ
jgi:uncharacterized protein (DUF342 family)